MYFNCMHVNISLLSIDIDNDIFTMNMIQTEFRLCIYSYLLCCYFKTHRVIVKVVRDTSIL